MTADSPTGPEGVRLFFSADLIGSTAYKNKPQVSPAAYARRQPPWADGFEQFYELFHQRFASACDQQAGAPVPCFFKAIGDELLFHVAIHGCEDAVAAMAGFRLALEEYNRRIMQADLPLSVKGSAWIAGFPINNHRVIMPDGSEDFIGPSIDAGFRLSRMATQRKLVVAVDLALLLLEEPGGFTFFFDEPIPLKGVLGGRPYPLIWIDTGVQLPEDRLLGVRKDPCERDELRDYCRRYIDSCGSDSWLIIPYLPEDDRFHRRPAWHEQIYTEWERERRKASVGLDQESGGDPEADRRLLEMEQELPEDGAGDGGP